MANESLLLRMLEPAVRPGNLPGPGPGVRPESAPIESRSFDMLLQEARQMNAPEAPPEAPPEASAPPRTSDPLSRLAQVDRIENDTLRRIVARPGPDI